MVSGTKRGIAFTILVCILIGVFTACSTKETPFKQANIDDFFKNLLSTAKQEEIRIYSLDAYYFDAYYYWHVKFAYNDEFVEDWTDADCVYLGQYRVELYINLDWPSTNWTDFPELQEYRESFYEAKEKGEHRSFTVEELDRYVKEFYEK